MGNKPSNPVYTSERDRAIAAIESAKNAGTLSQYVDGLVQQADSFQNQPLGDDEKMKLLFKLTVAHEALLDNEDLSQKIAEAMIELERYQDEGPSDPEGGKRKRKRKQKRTKKAKKSRRKTHKRKY